MPLKAAPHFVRREFNEYLRMSIGPKFGRSKRPDDQQRCASLSRGEVVTARIVSADNGLYHSGITPEYASVAVITFDAARSNDSVFLEGVGNKLMNYRNTSPQEPELKALADMLGRGLPISDRRLPVPPSITGGPAAFLVDMTVHRELLPMGFLENDEIICIADPMPGGAIEQVPYWIAIGMPAADGKDLLKDSQVARSRGSVTVGSVLMTNIMPNRAFRALVIGIILLWIMWGIGHSHSPADPSGTPQSNAGQR